MVLCATAVGVPIGLALGTGSAAPVAAHSSHRHGPTGFAQGPAEHQVLTALSTTTDAGSFQFTYSLSTTGPTANSGSGDSETPVSGMGTINTDPTAMAASAAVGDGAGLDVAVRVDGTDYWEVGSNNDQPAPLPTQSPDPGSALSSFAGLVESTLGPRNGAVAMLGMASPTGYLDLTLPSVTGATQVGTGTAGGVPVTEYDVSLDTAQLAASPGITPEEATTIDNALGILQGQGYSGTTVEVGIDASGFIRVATSTATFGDGGTVVLAATFSDFGCAGTVLMPGQPGSAGAPLGCVSPDTGSAPTTTTTTTTSSIPGPAITEVPATPTTVAGPWGSTTTTTTTTTTVAPTSSTTTSTSTATSKGTP